MSDKKKGKNRKKNILLLVLMLICVAVIGFSAYKLISIHLDYKAGTDEYDRLRTYTKETQAEVAPASETTGQESEAESSSGRDNDLVPHQKNRRGAEEFTAPIQVDHDSLKAITPDYVGWLYLGDQDISYPIVIGPDNDYYIHRSMEGGYLYSGTLFMDYQNTRDFSDPHTIVYGHNMKDQSMFGRLKLIREQGITDPYFWILTPEKNYMYKIFSMQICAYDAPVYTLFSAQGEEFDRYISTRYAESSLPGLDMEGALEPKKVVTLSTCYGTGETGDRFVVQGILVLEEENG